MARKFDLISELYRRTSKTVVASPQSWEAFLRSACRNFKLRFDEQLLVFAQRPDATAVLEISNDTKASWNGTFGRWVNRGATGIAVFEDADRSRQRIVHYFDISDTHPTRYARPVPIWGMKPEYTGEVIEALENTFGEMQDKSSLASAIMSAAQNATEDNIPDYISDLRYVTHDSFLEELHPDTVATLYKKVVANSVAYMMMSRLDMDPSMCFEDADFVDVVNFNTQETLNALGFATSDIAQMGLTEIARTVQSMERQNRTIAASQRDGYNVSKDDKENNIERSLENEPNYLHYAGRLQSSQSDNAPTDRSDTGQIRTDAEEISQGEPPGSVLQSADELQDERAFGEYRADGIGDGREAGERDGGETGRDGEPESDRHDELGSTDEQHPQSGSGNGVEASSLRLDYYDRSNEDKSLPFFGGDDTVREILGTTPHLKASKDEIRAFFETVADDDKRTEYIKSIFNNDYTEVILSDERRVGYKTYQNVLHLWEGSYLSRTAQSYYDWGVIANHFEAMRLLGELQDKIKPLPSMDGQMSLMLDYEAEVTKPSAFSFSQEIIDAVLCRGSGYSEGKLRIYEHFQKSLSKKENADFLKNEYGWGGRYPTITGTGIDELHDGKGIHISKNVNGEKVKVDLNWNQVEKRISELVKMDRYLNLKEKELYPQWLEQQEIRRAEVAEERRKREILSTAPPEKKEPKAVEERYEYHLGNTVYLGANEYEILSFDDERVMLFDTKFPLFNKEMERAAFEEKVRENPLNDHLKVSIPMQEEEVNLPASTQEESLATRLHAFYRDFDFYDYQDQLEAGQSEEDVIAEIEAELADVQMVRGIRVTLEEFKEEDSLLPEQEAAFDKLLSDVTMQEAKLLIDDFCKREYGDNNGADYADLSKIGVAYTTTEDDKHEIQTNVNLTELKIETFVDDTLVYAEAYPNLKSMIENALERLDFDELVAVSDDELAPFYEAEKIAPATDEVEETTQDVAQEVKKPVVPSWEQKPRTRVQTFDLHPEVPMADRHNFPLAQYEIAEVNKKERFHRNYAAITVLKKCQQENRFATPDEQKILSRYVGWGGIPEAFDERAGAWHTEYAMLKNILTPEEYNSAKESTLTAFYTPQTVISAVYKVMEQMGFREGNILEPSCGIGHFIGMLPASMEGSKVYGIELDTVSAGIAQQLYQKSSIAAQPFEETNLPDSFFDAVVGNVPFGDFKVPDKKYDKYKFLIHDYFFAKSLDKLRPGGVMALITSKGTMDKENPAVRKYIAQRADLLGAIRLPNDTFKGNAGTEVVSDILILQKRDRLIDIEPDWVHLDTDENGITMNSYFVQHPEMILGEMKMVSGRFGPEATCVPYANIDLAPQLEEAIANIHGEINDYETTEELAEEDNSIPADPNVRNFSYTVVDDKIYFRENSRMVPVEASTTAENRIKGMIAIRDCVRSLIALQIEDYPDADIKEEQEKLNTIYDGFVSKYGLINSRANSSAFSQDSSFSLLSALEVLGEGGELERKADMFFKRTIKPHTPVTSVDTSSEALAVSMGEKACVDMEYMMQLSGKAEAEIYQDLKGVIFLNPMYEYGTSTEAKYLMADEYLSGNVREKLAIAKRSAEVYPEDYTLHVEALEKVQPQSLSASEIAVRLGATWIPPEIVEQFIFSFLDTPRYAQWNIKTHFSPFTGEWNIEGKSYDRGNVKAYSTYGTSRINAYKIIEETLNLKDVRIFDYVEDDDGKKKAVLNKQETAIAQAKQELIKQGFQDWIWADPQRREKLTTLYNEKFNSIRPREYDGSHITFNGMNPEIELREHQKNAVAHILYGGNTLLAHAVGAGKTFEMVAAAMESKRLGLCNKSLFVVPNHLTEQWAAEFLQLYPSANILVATKKDFETKNRKRFCGRIATGDYDAIIIGHSQFEKIPMSIERQRGILEQQIEEITNGISDLKRNRGDSFSIKQLERTKKSVKVKLDKLNDQSRKDDVVTFEELGVDRLFIDESHYYKNLFLYTKMRNVGGIAQTEAQKSSDLFMKCRYLDEITGGRGTVFATGTPISNSMVELYTIQRYLQYNTLQRNGLQHFDAWASTFGETITAVELTPEGTGYRAKTRFAKFYNLPELMAMFKEVADIKTADMLDLPTPKANYHNVAVKPSDVQKELVASLSERADRVRNGMVDASVDNMLKITNDGRKIALEQRLVNDMLPDYAESKLNVCVSNIYRIWNETKENRSAQLVFCDLSTPKDDATFSVYTDIRKKLIALGIPPEEIKFIHEADTEVKKQELFQKTRKGEVRVLLGSTQKMGAGTNVQTKLKALHDIDCPWRPSDLEQRSGRIIRQGNENAEVDIFRYVTEETFDAYLYQLVESKQKFASQIMTSKSPVRSCEDIDETALSYAEIKMLATGNPYIKEKMDLDIQVQKLKLLKSNFLSEKYALEDRIIKYYPQEIARQQAVLAGLKADMALAEKHPKPQDDTFVGMTVQGVFYIEKADAGKEILSACQKMTNPDPIPLGEYRGFPMELFFDVSGREYKIKLKGELSYTVALGTDTFGNITRLDNVLEGFSKRLDLVQQELENTEKQFEIAKVDVQKPFNQEEELKAKMARLDELNILLNMDKRENEIVGGEPDEGDTDPTPRRKDRAR